VELSSVKAKVLIIDDDADIRNAIRLTLESEMKSSFTFAEADTVASGLRALKSTEPDVVILDLHMPGENGFDFIHKVKQSKLFSEAKVIILTAHGSLKNLLKAQNKGIGAYHFMSKPFQSDELLALVLSIVLPKPGIAPS